MKKLSIVLMLTSVCLYGATAMVDLTQDDLDAKNPCQHACTRVGKVMTSASSTACTCVDRVMTTASRFFMKTPNEFISED